MKNGEGGHSGLFTQECSGRMYLVVYHFTKTSRLACDRLDSTLEMVAQVSILDESLDLPTDKEILINSGELDETNIIAVISIFIRQDPHCSETSKNFAKILYSCIPWMSSKVTSLQKGKSKGSGQISPQIRH